MDDTQAGRHLFHAIVEGVPTEDAQTIFAKSQNIWRCSSFSMNEKTGAMLEANAYNFDQSFFIEYQSKYADRCLWRAAAYNQWKTSPVFVASRTVPFRRIQHTSFYNDFLQPNRLFDELISLMIPSAQSDELSGMTIYPRYGSGPFQDEDLVRMARRAGAFISFLHLRSTAIKNAVEAQFFRRAAGAAAEGVYLVSNDLEVRLFTRGAFAEVPENILRIVNDKIEVRDPREHRRLANYVKKISADRFALNADNSRRFTHQLGSWNVSGEQLVVTDPGWGFERSMVLLTVVSSGGKRSVRSALRERGLSGAEIEIVLSLADGYSPAEIADQRQRSVDTVRTQLRAAREKLGVRRQAELIREVVRLA